MTPWQILHASKASRAAPGYPAHHGHGVAVHYSTDAAAPDGSRSFCMSTDKLTMQELNSRLASYLQQVQCLEASNQKLECQILQELDRKCPGDLQELDGYLKMVSLLQEQITESLSVQGQLKLQLLTAELQAFNLKVRCENEQENRGRVEAELNNLRLQDEELMTHKLPELQNLLKGQTQQMMELQIQHQQNVQGLLAQASRGVAVEMQLGQSADLKLQLNDCRHTSVTLFGHNLDESCFNNQVPTLTFDSPAVSEVATDGLKQLRATAASLVEELMLLQAQNMQLESYGQQQMESSALQLEFLQQRADSLCSDLDSALQAAAQQAVNHQDLLDVKSWLEIEIQNYRRLLDGRGCQWVSKPADMSFCAPSNTAAFRRKLIQDKTVSFQEGNLNMGADQIQSYIDTVQQTPLFYPLPETVTTVGSIRVQNNSPLTSINTSKLIGYQSENKSENQRTGALSDKTEMESMMINRFSSLVEDKVHAINLETIEVGFKEGTNTNTEITETVTGADVKQESHFITQTTVTDPSTQTLAEVVIQTETAELDCTEGYVHDSNQDPAQVVSLTLDTQAEVISDDNNREEVEVKVEGTSLVHGLDKSLSLCDKSKSKQNDMKEDAVVGFGLLTASSCSTNSDDILVRESKTAGAETLRKSMTINRWSSLLEDKVHSVDPVLLNQSIVGIQISQGVEERSNLSLKLETQAEVVKDAGEVAVRAFEVSGSEGVQDEVSCEVTLMDDKNREEVEVEVEGTSLLHGLDQSLSSCDESNSKQKDVTEDADVGSGLLSATSCSANSDDILVRENKTASAEALRKSLTINRWSSLLEGNVHSTDPDLLDKLTVGIQISQGVEERSIMSLKLETQAEVVKDEGKVAVTAFEVSGSEGVQGEVSCEVTLMDDKNREEIEVESTSLVHGLGQSLSLCDESDNKQKDVKEDADVGSGLPTTSSCSTNSSDILVRESKTASAEALRKSMTINRWSSLLEGNVHSTDPDLLNKSIVGAQNSQGVKERSVVSLKLETQAEVVKDAGQVDVRAFEVSGSEGVQAEVSCEVTLMDDKSREEIEVEVESTSLVHGLDQGLSLCDESSSKQKDMKEDADEGSDLATATSCNANSDDILVKESKTASAEALRKSMTINRWSSLLEGNVHSTDPDLLDKSIVGTQISQGVEERSVVSLKLETQAEVVKDAGQVDVRAFEVSGSEGVQAEVSCEVTLMDDKNREEVEVEVEGTSLVLGLDQSLSLCDESNSKQKDMKEDADEGSDLATATSCNANSDDILVKESKTASAEALRKSMTINRWSSLLEGNVHSTDPDLLDKSIVGTQISQGVEERSVVSLKLETQAEVIKDAGQVDVRAFEVSGSEGVQAEVSCEVTLIDDKNREEVEVEVEGTSLVLGLDQSLSLCDESNSKQKDMKEDADEGSDLATATSCNANSDDILVKESKTASAEALRKSMTINRWSSLLEGNVLSTDPDLLDKSIVGTQISQGVEERSVVSLKLETQAEVVKDAGQVDVRAFEVSGSEGVQAEVSCEVTLMDDKNREEVEVEVEGTSLVLGLDQSSSLCDESNSKQKDMKEDADVGSGLPAATSCSANSDDILVREGKTASAEALRKSMTINRWSSLLEGNVHSTDPDLLNKSIVGTQISQGVEERSVVSLKLETQAEVVRDTGEVAVTAFEVSGSEGVQSEVSCEVTLMDDKSREEVEIKVEGTSLVHGLDQSLSLCDESNSKQNDVKEDADVGSSLLTASSCSTNNDDILVREGITASAETLRKTMTINRWSSLLEDKVHLVDPDLPKKTMVGTQISQGVEERSNLSLKLETQAEVVKDEDKVAITAFEVSGSEGVQGEVSCEVTLMDDKNREEIEVEVESTSLVHGLDKNLSFCDVSNSKQNNIKEDADAGPGLLIASPCISDRNDNLNTKSINASAETLRKSITVNRWSSLLEPKVHSIDPLPTIDLLNKSIVGTQISQGVEERSVVMSSKTEINTTIGITSSLPNTQPVGSAGVQDEPESFFLKQTTMEVKATETAQIDCTEDYVHAKNENPAQVVSLKLETQAGVVRDAGEVVVTTFEVTGSEGVQGEVSCEVTLMDDENREEVEVEGTSLVRGLDQSFSLCDESNSKQNKVKEDVDVGFSLPTASSCKANSDDILVRESTTVQSKEIMKEAELEVNREEVVTGFHVTNGVKLASLTDCGVILSSCDDEEPLSTTVPVACPIETEVCPIDPKMNLSQNDPETCLSKVEAKVCLSLTGEEEDDKVCLNLTEASVCVRPVEKYILSTKEESQYISSSRGQALLDTDRNRKVTTSVKNGSSLHFESFDGSSVGSLETRHGSEDQTETPNMDSKERGQISSECLVDSKADDSFGNVPAPGGTSFRDAEGKMSGMDCSRGGMAARFDDTTANSAGTVGGDTDAVTTSEIQGEIRLDSEEWMVQGGNRGRSKLPRKESEESSPVATLPATSQPGTGRFGKKGSGEWIVYGGSIGRKSSLDGNGSLPNMGSEDSPSVATQLATKTSRKGRFGSTGSGEWRVYGGSTGSLSSGSGSERVRVSTSSCKIITTPGNQMGSGNRVSSAGSVLRRSNSQGSAEKLSSSGSGGKLSSSSGNHMISISGKYSTGSGESKPVYSSASGHKSSVGSGGQPGRGKTTTRHRTHSPAERRSVSGGSGGWLSSSSAGGNRISSTGSGSKLSGSGSIERINSRGGGRGMSSPRLGRANSAGGRVITSSNGPVRSTGSGAGNNHERISVCKMAALSMSAAGRERSQERQRQAQRSAKQEASASPLIQRWLTSTDEVPLAEPDGLDDIIHP